MTAWPVRVWKTILFIALVGATWVFLSPGVPEAPGISLQGIDKVYHALTFAVLSGLAIGAYPEKPRWGIFASLVFYGACIEIAQGRTGRTPELFDVAADAIGALVAFTFPRVRAPRSH